MNAEITPNPEYKGIEIRFDGKPSEEVRDKLKQFRFRWHRVKKLWYGSDSKAVRMMLEEQFGVDTNSLLGTIEEEPDIPHASLESIERRRYFLVDYLYKDLEDSPSIVTYLLFHQQESEAENIAWKFGNKLLGDTIETVSMIKGKSLNSAKELFAEGKIIGFDPQTGQLRNTVRLDTATERSSPEPETSPSSGPDQAPSQPESITNSSFRSLENEESEALLSESNVGLSPNEQIERLLLHRETQGKTIALSPEERELLLRYEPDGGKATQGVEGSGILYEYFTPDEVVRKMWGLAYEHGFKVGGKVLEPSCGIGGFLPYVPPSSEAVCYETNPISAQITQLLYPWAEVQNDHFESRFFSGTIAHKGDFGKPEFDLVIGNPPYGKFHSTYAGMGEKKYTKATRYEEYFIIRGLDLLRPGGLLVYIIPSGFLSGVTNKAKQEIDKRARILLDAYRLPSGIFPTTSIGTDILVLKKK